MPIQLTAEQVLDGTELTYERGRLTGTRKYIVRYNDGATALTAADVLDSAPVPAYLDAWDTLYPNCRVLTRQAEPMPGSEVGLEDTALIWSVTLGYGGQTVEVAPPDEPGYILPETDADAQTIDHWRLPTFSYFPTGEDSPIAQDIGGVRVDIEAEPISGLVRNMTLAVTNVYVAEPNAMTYMAYVATRNDVAIFGAGIGMLVLLPFQKARLANGYWSVTWRMMWDGYGHMRQAPVVKAATGEPHWGLVTIEGVAVRQAESVIWRQPFRLADSHGLTWADLPISVA